MNMNNLLLLGFTILTVTVCYSIASDDCGECKVKYEKIGCFKDESRKDRALPEELLNERDKSNSVYNGHMINWKTYSDSLSGLACRCAAKAKEKGYKVFGLQYFGECWSGPGGENTYAKFGEADRKKCFQDIYRKDPHCKKCRSQDCVGGKFTNYVYRIKESPTSPPPSTVGPTSQPPPPSVGLIILEDWMLSSSSEWNYNHRAAYGKLNFRGGRGIAGAWCARSNNQNQWLLVDFGREMKVTGISTQGRHDFNQWVTSYTVEYSQDGVQFTVYTDGVAIKKFTGNSDRNTVVTHQLPTPIVCQYVRLRPKAWYRHISIRVGIYGYPTGKKPASPYCHKAMDVGIIMDRSGSIGAHNFRRAQDFIASMINHFEYASQDTRFGIIAYNSRARTIFRFSDAAVQNPKTLMRRVYGIRYLRGGTRTDRALQLANKNLYSSQGGYRSNVPQVLFVLTDGKTNRGSRPYPKVLEPLLNKKIRIIAVGVGRVEKRELCQIAGDCKHVFQVNAFHDLSRKLKDILNASCP